MKENSIEEVAKLLKDSLNINEKFEDKTLLLHAVENGQYQVAELLLERGADPNYRYTDDKQPLHHAVINGNLQLVEKLISRGADPDRPDQDGKNPLDYAAGNEDIKKVLEKAISEREKRKRRYQEIRQAQAGRLRRTGLPPDVRQSELEKLARFQPRARFYNAPAQEAQIPTEVLSEAKEATKELLEAGVKVNEASTQSPRTSSPRRNSGQEPGKGGGFTP